MFGGEDEEEIPPEEKPDRIKELVEALPPEAEEEATDLIKQTDDADEVIEGLEQIIASHSPDSADEAVSKAESFAHLARMLDTDGSITSWVEARVDVLTRNETAQLRDVISEVPAAVESRADEVVQQADSAETLTEDLTDLIETHYEQQADEVVTDAHSVSDLVSTLEHNHGAIEEESNADSFLIRFVNKRIEGSKKLRRRLRMLSRMRQRCGGCSQVQQLFILRSALRLLLQRHQRRL